MTTQAENVLFFLLLFKDELRNGLFHLLSQNKYRPLIVAGLQELLEGLKAGNDAIVFLGSDAVKVFGSAVYAKAKRACPSSRIILMCEQLDRDLIREAMDHGVYGCILEPYHEWEVLSLVKPILADFAMKSTKPKRT
jgi:DNA-binding NtrC family response regulator